MDGTGSSNWDIRFLTRLNIIYSGSPFNRQVTTKRYCLLGGEIMGVSNGHLGWVPSIFYALSGQIDAVSGVSGKAWVFRADLWPTAGSSDNGVMSAFIRRLKKHLRRRYPNLTIGYQWVREQEKAKGQHYHFVLIVDAERVPAAAVLSKAIIHVWTRLTGNQPHIPKRPYYLIKHGDWASLADAMGRCSYLAKSRGKGYKPDQTKNVSTSRLRQAAR